MNPWLLLAALVLAVAVVAVCRAVWPSRRAPAPRRVWGEDEQCWTSAHDVGPDPLRLLTDLEAHLKAYGATVADFYDIARDRP